MKRRRSSGSVATEISISDESDDTQAVTPPLDGDDDDDEEDEDETEPEDSGPSTADGRQLIDTDDQEDDIGSFDEDDDEPLRPMSTTQSQQIAYVGPSSTTTGARKRKKLDPVSEISGRRAQQFFFCLNF